MTMETDLLHIDDQLSNEERLIRDTVRAFVTDQVLPNVGDWFEAGMLPRPVLTELGKLGLFGMHLTGYGCAGTGPIAYGVACRELERGRLRTAQRGVRARLARDVPDLEVRKRRAEGAVASAHGQWLRHRLLRAHRTGSWL